MAISYLEELNKQDAVFNNVKDDFSSAKALFESTATDPGSGFDLDAWMALLPEVLLRTATFTGVDDPDSYNANDLIPNVTPPTLVTPANASLLAEQGYDSAYLEELEQEIRTLTADIISAVLPVSVRDSFFTKGDLRRAKEARDKVDSVIIEQHRRGFPAATMTTARNVADTINAWQEMSYKNQEEISQQRLDVALRTYFESIGSGIKIEDVRSRMILAYAKIYSDHNTTLIGYYGQLVDEKIASARLLLDNAQATLEQDVINANIINSDNEEEVELPSQIYSRAIARLENEFKVDTELIGRRRDSLVKICDAYAGWMSAAAGSLQSTVNYKHDVSE